ncbi:MAG TPA: DEAD/DEAH box helicase [Chloroflexi bacterium]|nr:DEAD/DEAH box helicase [Chloroflexota bacterium]
MMTTDFSQLTLHPTLIQAAAELGFITPTEVQSRVIPLMLDGKDVLAQSQTGSGKTAAFAFPILNSLATNENRYSVSTLVLAPTRELAIQVAEAIQEYGRHIKVSVLPIYGGQHYGTSRRRLKEGVDVVVGTPGRLQDLIRQKMLDLSQVHTVVLDEADEMLSMGFVDDVENILQETPSTRQTTLFSATLPQSIRRLADKYMHDPETIMVQRKALTVDTVDQRYYLVKEKDKLAALTRLFEAEDIGSTLVFTKTRVGSGKVANNLIQRGFPAEALNGDLSQDARIRVLDRFKTGRIKVLVATDVAARGLDINDITHVVNYDTPTDPEAYVHRIGRTGRAGKDGIAISLLTPKDKRYLSRIEGYSKSIIKLAQLPTEKDLNERRDLKLLEKLEAWLERDRCKREQELVEYMIASGHDPVKIAASALKMARKGMSNQPLAKITPVEFKESSSKKRHGKKGSHRNGKSNRQGHFQRSASGQEIGMVRLSINRGRIHGIRPGEIVGGIASRADIPGNGIGRITINEKSTLIDVQKEYVPAVLKKSGSYHFHDNHKVDIRQMANQ